MDLRLPPPLEPGQTVAICAPSSPFPREELWRGLAWLRTRYDLRLSRHVFGRRGYLAGTDLDRASDLAARMLDPSVRAIVCARGGYGAMRVVQQLPWEAFARDPKWIIGFSDVTALHVMAMAHGVASVHGPNVTGLGRSISPSERLSFLTAVEAPSTPRAWHGLTVVHPGQCKGQAVSGPVVGGNLALVSAMAGVAKARFPDKAIVLLEDVTERPYRIDRMLMTLVLGGAFARASALVFGGFLQCEPGPDGVTVADVLRETTAHLGIPVLMDAPFGHGTPNHAFVLGSRATVVGDVLHFGA